MVLVFNMLVSQSLIANLKGCTKLLLATFVLIISNSARAQQCKDYIPNLTPNSRYTADTILGTVLDNSTGLMWQQCSVGQSQLGANCVGKATTMNWQSSLQAADQANVINLSSYTDWRLPTIKELRSLIALHCINASINTAVFSNTVNSSYWSSSPYVGEANDAWTVDFYHGISEFSSRENAGYVRLVRL